MRVPPNLWFLIRIILPFFVLVTCGYLKKKDKDKDGDSTFGNRIPSSWNGDADWEESSFAIEKP